MGVFMSLVRPSQAALRSIAQDKREALKKLQEVCAKNYHIIYNILVFVGFGKTIPPRGS